MDSDQNALHRFQIRCIKDVAGHFHCIELLTRGETETEITQRIALIIIDDSVGEVNGIGGICLQRILEPDLNFRFEDYFPAVVEEFKLAGKDVEIKMKHKGQPSAIESAFLKESSDVFDIGFTTEKRLKVKIEVDINPPPKFSTEMRVLESPRNCLVRSYDLPGLYAGKVSAALFRRWKTRVKGRDWYDLVWYISNHVELDLAHLIERGKESEPTADVSTPEKLLAAFDAKIDALDLESAKNDVYQYLMDTSELDIWSKDFFHQMVRKIRFQEK